MSLIHDTSWVILMNENRNGRKNFEEKNIRLVINKFLGSSDFQETTIAKIADKNSTNPMHSKVSEISVNTIDLFEDSKTLRNIFAYAISSKIVPTNNPDIQA